MPLIWRGWVGIDGWDYTLVSNKGDKLPYKAVISASHRDTLR